jgi:hypothetical protein
VLNIKTEKQKTKEHHKRVCLRTANRDVQELDIMVCTHGKLLVAVYDFYADLYSSSRYVWEGLNPFWSPIMYYRARRALQETDNA